MKKITVFFMTIAIILVGCKFDVTDMQSIDISTYSETEKNVKLAEDLMYYDPRYIAYKVPSFNEQTSQGIRLGYFVRSSDGKPSYRITYSMRISAVAENIDSLKSEFENFIPKLASFHASKSELFQKLSPKGRTWAQSLFDRSAEEILSNSSVLLKDSVTAGQFATALSSLSTEYGNLASTEFVRAQYYEAFDDIPESVSLFYLQTYDTKKKTMTRVSMHRENGNWMVMGFKIEPFA